MELETDSRASLEFLPARQRDGFPSPSYNMSATLSMDVPRVPRYTPSTVLLSDMLSQGPLPARDMPRRSTDTSGCSTPTKPASFRFDGSPGRGSFNLPLRGHSPPRGIKRRRKGQDVDGPNTAGLCCKKRRLRADLITSRLSQPFSQPATHILNREGAESGDKRFLKMATSVDAVRRIAQLHATSFLRFSVMNSIRKRLGIPRPGLQRVPTGPPSPAPPPREVEATAKAPWKPQSLQVASRATYWRPSGVSGAGPSTPPAASPGDRSQPAAKASVVPRVSKPIALPMPASDLAATKERTAPRIHSVPSPELRPDTAALDDMEEDSFAFLHPEFDDYGDDDPEHVYSDFGAIFRSGSPDGQSDDHSYEEYLDELDGISWATR